MKYEMVQSIARRSVWVAAVLLLGACGEIAAPGEAPRDDIPTVSADLKDAPAGTLRQKDEIPRLATYDTTFVVTQGRANVVKVCYEDAESPCSRADTLNTGVEDVSSWFLKVMFHRSTQYQLHLRQVFRSYRYRQTNAFQHLSCRYSNHLKQIR